jgi:hypothetical protein
MSVAAVLLGRLAIEIAWGMMPPLDEGSTLVAERVRSRRAVFAAASLTRSLIPQEHRPILDQLHVRLSLQ